MLTEYFPQWMWIASLQCLLILSISLHICRVRILIRMPELTVENLPVVRLVASLVLLIVFLVTRRVLVRNVSRRANDHDFAEERAMFVRRSARVVISIIFIVTLLLVWEVSFSGLSVYIVSFLTIVGVGLVANWSIVSNITAAVILFFFFPFKIGSRVKIVDGDNSAEGVVTNLSIFSIRIRREDGIEIYYPNNLAIQKSILHLK